MIATRAEARGAAAAPATWRCDAFGIGIEGDFAAPGLPPASGVPVGPRTAVRVVPASEIEHVWRGEGARRLLEERFDEDPEAARSIDHLPGVGYRLYARHFGLALVAEDGRRVLCAPPDDEAWSWQRFLVGRVLPWTAVLLGREVFHAGAVALGGRAFALVGASGAGKSSLVAHLLLGGARFLTDDVLAIDDAPGMLRAHPGAAILCVRPAEREAMGVERWRRLGPLLGDSGKLYVEVERDQAARPLSGVYFLAPGAAGAAAIEPIDRPDFRLLLGSTFNESLQGPERLRRQFDLCAQLAARVPMFRLRVPRGVSAAELAARVRAHADALARRPA
jgi:hypothetical protein